MLFLDRSAGFGIVQHLIDYQEGDTYGRVFLVGLLNTLLVSALCIVFASILGFLLASLACQITGLLRKLSTIYIETFREYPAAAADFFSGISPYCVTFRAPRQAVDAFDLFFLSNCGLYIPFSS